MKKLVSLFLSLCICLSVVFCMPMSADAAYNPTVFKTYDFGIQNSSNRIVGEADYVKDLAISNLTVAKIRSGSFYTPYDADSEKFISSEFDFYAKKPESSQDNSFMENAAFRFKIVHENFKTANLNNGRNNVWTGFSKIKDFGISYDKWCTIKIVLDKTENKCVISKKTDGKFTIVETRKILSDETLSKAGLPNLNGCVIDSVGFDSVTGDNYIVNIVNKRYISLTDALASATDAAGVKDIMEFFGENGIITLNSELSDLAANKVYTALAGKTFDNAAAVQAKYDELAAKYNVNYIVDFGDAGFTIGNNAFSVNFANNSDADVNAILVNAVYGSDKTLIGIVDSKSITVAKGQEADLTATGAVSEDAAKVKQIVIDSYDTLTPYAKANELGKVQ